MPTKLDSKAVPQEAEFVTVRSYLATAGAKQADIDAAIDTSVKGRKREEICEKLREWMRTLPAATPAPVPGPKK